MGRSRDDVAARPNFHGAVTASDVNESLDARTSLGARELQAGVREGGGESLRPATSDLGLQRPVHQIGWCIEQVGA
jgi:hypothetical protein